MAAPKGNKNAVGNRGGGRKSAYQEMADAKSLRDMFFSEFSIDEAREKVKSGKHSLKDAFVLKGFAGSERVLLAIFNKVFPDQERPDEKNGAAPRGKNR